MKKEIDFFKTSNQAIEINEMFCSHCEEVFYELENHELEDCPHCGESFDGAEPSKNAWDSDTFTLIVDAKTGIPSVIRNDEYDPIMREFGREEE